MITRINARMGGINSIPRGQGLDWIAGQPTMVVGKPLLEYNLDSEASCLTNAAGADVSHPGPGVMKPSITGIAYSLDPEASKYCALTGLQQPRLEIIEGLKDMMKVGFDCH